MNSKANIFSGLSRLLFITVYIIYKLTNIDTRLNNIVIQLNIHSKQMIHAIYFINNMSDSMYLPMVYI